MSIPFYLETKVAARLGISRPDFKYLRAEVLKKNKGWVMHGREVALTQDGLETILAHLRASSNVRVSGLDFSEDRVLDHLDAGKKEGAEPREAPTLADKPELNGVVTPPEFEELTVHRIYPNPRLLVGRTAAGALVDVTVKNNRNFVPKMKLKARLVRLGRYEMEGRCPRFKGRY